MKQFPCCRRDPRSVDEGGRCGVGRCSGESNHSVTCETSVVSVSPPGFDVGDGPSARVGRHRGLVHSGGTQ